MNLADPELELLDPTPNVHALFIQFDRVFFWAKLASRAVVRWSKRMYSCAGVCSYEGRGGLCDIALSEPLLKLRPRKDLIETLLHEMIHAFLFIMNRDQDRDGHGPNFKEHMYRINKAAGLNISIYHDFHDEVKLYQTHWWRCNGPCQTRKPFFGIVRRSQNRAPGPNDFWWSTHQKSCGGTFAKIKEPEKKTKKEAAVKNNKKVGDITKYVKMIDNKTASNNKVDNVRKPLTPIVKNATGVAGAKVKSNGGNTLVITQKSATNSPVTKPPSSQPPSIFGGKGQTVSGDRKRTNSVGVVEAVRNVWANKQLPGLANSQPATTKRKSSSSSSNATNMDQIIKLNELANNSYMGVGSPPSKIKKIDDYFKNSATSILKDVYGQDFRLTQANNKIVAKEVVFVDCPICNAKVDNNEINRHIDECLNKDVIEKLSKDNIEIIDSQISQTEKASDKNHLKRIVGKVPVIPSYKNNTNDNFMNVFKEDAHVKPILNANIRVDLTNIDNTNILPKSIKHEPNESQVNFDPNDVNRVKAIVKKITFDKHIRKSDNFVVVKDEPNEPNCGFLPSFLDDMGCAIKAPPVKIEPGTSKDIVSILTTQKCPCCGNKIDKPMAEHLDECLSFFDNNTTMPEEGASTSFANNTIVIDDEDDIFDETLTMNATGTKTPCPCCLEMIEMADMNAHLDNCLS